MNPTQSWLDPNVLFPEVPPLEQAGLLVGLAVAVSSLRSTSPLSMVMKVGGITGS